MALPGRGALIAAALPMMLGGVLSVDPDLDRHWSWSGAWVYPVGAERAWQAAAPGGPGYMLLRGFATRHARHLGADLGDGRAGGAVCASAHGIVVLAVNGRDSTDWGNRVVIAHRLVDGSTVYSVYAHLLPGSIRARPGECVSAGEPIARVGRSGNATTPHLHFEVRVTRERDRRWEKATAVDPLAFVAKRLVAARSPGQTSTCLTWAEETALLSRGAGAEEPLRRADWWSMLVGAARHDADRIPGTADSLGACLRAAGVLEDEGRADPDEVPPWKEMARDLERLQRHGNRLPPVPLSADLLEATVEDRLGSRFDLSRLEHRHPDHPPRIADGAMLMAAIAGARPESSAAR